MPETKGSRVQSLPDELNIGSKLKDIRLSANLSKGDIASALGGGYSSSAVTDYEGNKRPIGLNLLVKWAKACKKNLVINFN